MSANEKAKETILNGIIGCLTLVGIGLLATPWLNSLWYM